MAPYKVQKPWNMPNKNDKIPCTILFGWGFAIKHDEVAGKSGWNIGPIKVHMLARLSNNASSKKWLFFNGQL